MRVLTDALSVCVTVGNASTAPPAAIEVDRDVGVHVARARSNDPGPSPR